VKNKKGNGDGKMDQTYMKEKPVVPLLLSMGIPVIISMIAGALYNIVDSIFVAMISEDAMTAVSAHFPASCRRAFVTHDGSGSTRGGNCRHCRCNFI